MIRFGLLAGLALVLSSAASAEVVKGWNVEGSEHLCAATSSYEGGNIAMMMFNGEDWAYGVGNPKWTSLTEGDKITLDVHFDWINQRDVDRYHGEAEVVELSGRRVGLGAPFMSFIFGSTTEEFAAAWAVAKAIRIYRGNKFIVGLKLIGTYEATLALKKCAANLPPPVIEEDDGGDEPDE